jgi:hypothetical protein
MPDLITRHRRLLFALLLVAGTLALRWPTLARPVWNLDEGSTVTMAQLILKGQVPYLEAADNRTPLVPYVKALVLAVAGDWNTWAIHAFLALMLGTTAVLLWQTARRLGHEAVGVMAALVFFWLSAGLIPDIDGFTAHTGWFVIFFSSLGFWIWSGGVTGGSHRRFFFAGVAFGLATLAKQPGLLDFGVTVVIGILLAVFQRETRSWRQLPPLLLGFGLPLAITVIYFKWHGALDDLIFYAWTYNTKYYVPEVPLADRLAAIRVPFALLYERTPAILALGLIAAPALLWTAFGQLRRRPAVEVLAWMILGWSASGLVSTMLSGRDFPHYSMQIIPGVSLAAGWVLAGLVKRAATWRAAGQRVRWIVVHAVIVAVFTSLAVPTIRWFSGLDLVDGNNPAIGRFIRAHTRPDERIFIWGYMPEMHVYARRLPATRFFYTNWVTGLIPWTNRDWFKDTKYAVIPGTPELLRQDFERHPPALVLDTRRLRSYLKYPIQEQAWLWQKLEYEFAELDPELVNTWGFRIYRRIADARYGAPFPAGIPVTEQVRIDAPAATASATVPVKISFPDGTEFVEFYKDGELYRRIECDRDKPGMVVFHAMAADLPPGDRRLQAVVRGRQTLASAERPLLVTPAVIKPPDGPPLEFEGQTFPPLVASNADGAMHRFANSDRWNAYAPARITYERPTAVYGIEFEYGLDDILAREPERWKTDGIDVSVHFENAAGQNQVLFNRHLDARAYAGDQGLQKQKVLLPLNEPGRITLWISPGKESDASADWAYVKSVRGMGAPFTLAFRDQKFSVSRIDSPFGLALFTEKGEEILMVHAPSEIEFTLRPGMNRLAGIFGLMPSAWNGPKGSAGAIFEVWHLPSAGEPKLLHGQLVDPVHNSGHRGHQAFQVDLPQSAEGRIRLVARPAQPQDNSFNHTYWGALQALEFHANISTPAGPVAESHIEARFGYGEMVEAKRKVLFAHAPSEIVFPLPRGLRRLTGEIGLLASAYAGPELTEGSQFLIELENASGQRTVVWQRDLTPQEVAADRGFIPFTVDLPDLGSAPGRLILRTDARAGHGFTRAWTFWHDLRLAPLD